MERSDRLGLFETIITLVVYFNSWVLFSYHPSVFWAPWFSLLMLRLFMIYHDAGHGSICVSSRINNWIVRILSVITLTPTSWITNHRYHHQISGNLDKHDWNETIFMTTQEYQSLTLTQKLIYRIWRQPVVFFLTGPILNWFVLQRLPIRLGESVSYKPRFWNTVLGAGWFYLFYFCLGWTGVRTLFLQYHIGGVMGLMLFHLQHSFNPGYLVSDKDWVLKDSAIQGSSVLPIPRILKWFTFGIEYHPLHHVNTLIPGYCLEHAFSSSPDLQQKSHTLTWTEIKLALNYTMYNTESKRFESFP